jgi:hypothetical protein
MVATYREKSIPGKVRNNIFQPVLSGSNNFAVRLCALRKLFLKIRGEMIMKKFFACLIVLSFLAPVGLTIDVNNANAEIRSATKKGQDEAYKAGKSRAEGYKKGESGKVADDDYRNMDDREKEAYKKGYRDGQ